MISKVKKSSVIKFLLLVWFFSAFTYAIYDSRQPISPEKIELITGNISYKVTLGRTYKLIVTNSEQNIQLKFLCYKDNTVKGYLSSSGGYCFSDVERKEMRGKLAIVAWYPRNVGFIFSRKQLLSVTIVDGNKYLIDQKFTKNELLSVVLAFLIFLPVILFLLFSKNAFPKKKTFD